MKTIINVAITDDERQALIQLQSEYSKQPSTPYKLRSLVDRLLKAIGLKQRIMEHDPDEILYRQLMNG
jgi:hypothetical protein